MNIKEIVDLFGKEIIIKMKEKLISGGKGDSLFIQNLKYQVDEPTQGLIQMVLDMPEYGEKWIDGMGYEYTRRPEKKMPPEGSLLDWMSRKGIRPEKEWIVRKGISIRGIRAVPFLYIWSNNVPYINKKLEQGAYDELEKEIDTLIDKINKT